MVQRRIAMTESPKKSAPFNMEAYTAILVALNEYKIRQYDIAESIGVTREHFNRLLKKKTFSVNQLHKIQDFFDVHKIDIQIDIPEVVVPASGSIVKNHTRTVSKPGSTELIPYYDIDFVAGNSSVFIEESAIPEYYMDIPEFRGCKAFRAYSDSMEELIKSGNILFARKLEEWQIHLEYGQIYGIVMTDKRRYLKYIKKAKENPSKDFFSLESRNMHYDPFEVPKNKIHSIWLIEGWLNKSI